MNRNNWRWSGWLMVLFLTLILVTPALAVESRTGDMVNVSGGVIKGPLFVSGNNITVDADVDGDVFAAGQTVTVNGRVTGDVIAAANSVRVSAAVLGDIRAAANTIDVTGPVEGNVTAAGNNVSLGQSSSVKRDALLFGNSVQIYGPVSGQVLGSASQFNINSSIGGNIRIWDVQKLSFGPAAVVGGLTTYNSATQAEIAPGAKIGAITQLAPRVQPTPPVQTPIPMQRGFSWGSVLWSLATGLLIWGAGLLLLPKVLPRLGQTAKESPWPSLGWGFLALLVAPFGIILLMITVIGIPLAFILIFSYIITFMVAKVVVSDAIARVLSRSSTGRTGYVLYFMISLLAIILLCNIPVGGFFFTLITACAALGIIILTIGRHRAAAPPTAPTPSEPASAELTAA
jgi:cytoskeletal protein CcmA (bactofilin family)